MDELIVPATMAKGVVRAVYTIRCGDVDARVAALRDMGLVALNGPMDRPWGIRTVSYADSKGHVWELAQ